MNQMIDKSCREFMAVLSGKEPAPGGGGAAALGAALGMGLANMVGSLTTGKKKYAEYEEEVQVMLADGLQLQTELLDLVAADAAVFEPLAAAYGLPANTDEERANKNQILSDASIEATKVPLAIAEKTHQAMVMARRISEIGSRLAVSDAGCAILFLDAALGAARYNVMINLPLINETSFVESTKEKMAFLLEDAKRLVNETTEMVDSRL
jgi:formiminotetrahydrofolate cyclodeaminase